MRYIAIALLALLVCTTVMAADSYGNKGEVAGPVQEYWCWLNDDYTYGGGVGSPNTFIDVSADVQPWAWEKLAGNKINFTILRSGVTVASDPLLNQTFANFSYRIYLTAGPVDPSCNIQKMKLSTPTSYGTGATEFPIVWKYQIGAATPVACTYDETNNYVNGPTFTAGGSNDFNWIVEASPAMHQKPGGYVLDPIVVIAPVF